MHWRWPCRLLVFMLAPITIHAEDGSAAWLRYAPVSNVQDYQDLPSRILVLGNSPIERSAASELERGLSGMLERRFVVRYSSHASGRYGAIVLATMRHDDTGSVASGGAALTSREAYRIRFQRHGAATKLVITGATPAAQLYGVFHLLEEIAAQRPIPIDEHRSPAAAVRWTDEWDNLDGSIERGYAGQSIFFAGGHVRQDLTRAGEYARLLASIGINGCNVNNVNADPLLLSSEHLREFGRLASAFRPWGVKLALSVDLSSPTTVGHLATFDPADGAVIAWWQHKVDEIYQLIPDFGGFTVKADSEGRAGPLQYGRTPADAANMLARALRPHGGIVLYRGFVYNHHLDWRDAKADRARAGYDNFASLDGKFAPNVVIQIKHGPIDFQAREPVSPLFAALRHSNRAIELETTQEYTGQQCHMVWLPSMWKWVLDTDMRAESRSTPVKEIVGGRTWQRPLGGFVSVVNVGTEPNWLHHPMAMANLYGFGRLAWNPEANLQEIAETWTRLTWGNDPDVVRTVSAMLLGSWRVYEGYTGPNGMGTLTDILGVHFGPGIESAERNGWGQWFRSEGDGVGMDRTVATGTGYIAQYPPELAARYESLASCPDDLLLFFHHVRYDYTLHSGKTLVQSIYDTHYSSALAAAEYVPQWQSLRGKMDDERYGRVLTLLTYQAGHAVVWRDAINNWFQRVSGIADVHGRVGYDPHRIEAEDMAATGYRPIDITPWETASGGKAMICDLPGGCSLHARISEPAGTYDVAVQYFDLRTGISHYQLSVNDREVARWAADDTLPPAVVRAQMDGQTSTRYTAHGVALKPGDMLELRGTPDLRGEADTPGASRDPAAYTSGTRSDSMQRGEPAPVDYLELGPDGPITPQ